MLSFHSSRIAEGDNHRRTFMLFQHFFEWAPECLKKKIVIVYYVH